MTTEEGLVAGTPALVSDAAIEAAEDAARVAADRSGVRIKLLRELADLRAVVTLVDDVWRPAPDSPLVTIEQLRAMEHAGNYVAGVLDGADLIGVCFGFFAAPPGVGLHSHIAGVAARARGRSVGFALKLHQRAWALRHGLVEITWTFDPLVRRNAHFNLAKLGAVPREYLVDFYGNISDAINSGQGSDRLLVAWDLLDGGVLEANARRPAGPDAQMPEAEGAVVALRESSAGGPEEMARGGHTVPDARIVLVQTPADIEELRQRDQGAGTAWRQAVRDVLTHLLSDGARIRGFTRTGFYVVERA